MPPRGWGGIADADLPPLVASLSAAARERRDEGAARDLFDSDEFQGIDAREVGLNAVATLEIP
jgi:hypothetical protein